MAAGRDPKVPLETVLSSLWITKRPEAGDELPVVLERRRRFHWALRAGGQLAMDVVIAALDKSGPATFDNLDDPLEVAGIAARLEGEK